VEALDGLGSLGGLTLALSLCEEPAHERLAGEQNVGAARIVTVVEDR